MLLSHLARCGRLIACMTAFMSMPVAAAERPRLDLQADASRPLQADQPIFWTIAANNGGQGAGYGALAAWRTFFDSGTGTGAVIFDRVPFFRGAPLALVAPPTVKLRGTGDGVKAEFHYSRSQAFPRSPREWTATYAPHARWIALLLSTGSGAVVLPAAPERSNGAGAVVAPQVLITFATKQPTGVCSHERDATTNMANGVLADKAGTLLGPGIPIGTPDGVVSLAAAAENGKPGSGPLRVATFRTHRRWGIFGKERCEAQEPTES